MVKLFRITNTLETYGNEIEAQEILRQLYFQGCKRVPCEIVRSGNEVDVFLIHSERLHVGKVSKRRIAELNEALEHSPRMSIVLRMDKRGFCIPNLRVQYCDE